MSDLSNTPVIPGVSPRGWTPAARTRFLEHLALKGHVRAACAHVGLSAEAAYRLRRRDPLFARGWAAALVLAHDHGEQVLAARAIDGVEEPVYYRGEQVGTRRKYDTRLLLAHLARLDRMAENRAAQRDAGRFDDLLAVLAGAPCPEGLAGEDALPLPREQAIARAVAEAEQRLFHGDEDADEDAAEEADAAGEEDMPLWRREDEAYFAVRAAAEGEAAAQWDAWRAEAYALVDELAMPEEAAVKAMGHCALLALRHPRAGGDPEATAELDSRLRGNDERGEGNGAEGAIGDSEGSPATVPPGVPAFTPCTVSTVSTSALARIIAGPARGFAVADHPAFHARKRR
ncbi:hypothetical protein [Caenibius sp. WL]|uniref:hypothetical protein n=1 Tax=Caenibius sp. WL TaxID=2872646 RepID=UPI001C998806|nr:hypothetical protein [Caenibius sp. WL]QZP08042.1 hypothetical protein K5X80_15610 [Caenibius sp. WL]QZP09328.1 hypothetical protein K5X80_06130 [Caenibius sp. WL]